MQDYKEALKWILLSAEGGNSGAQFGIGSMYQGGQGVIQNFVIAHMWFNISAASGDADAAQKRDMLAKQMTPSDISKAQKLAREWMEQYQSQ